MKPAILGVIASIHRRGFQANVLADGPIAYWKLDESVGATTAIDSSPSGLNATVDAAKTTFGSASLIDSGSSINITTADASAPIAAPFLSAMNFGSGDFTLLAVLKTSNADARQRAIITRGDINSHYANWSFHLDSGGHIALLLRNSDANVGTEHVASVVANNNVRHLVVARRTSGTVQLFQDNVEVFSGADSTAMWASPVGVAVGCSNHSAGADTTSRTFLGLIDEVAVFNKAVADARLSNYYSWIP